MTAPNRDCAPAGSTAGARGSSKAAGDRRVAHGGAHAWAGKQVAMLLYNSGAVTLAATSAAFARHPSWRSA